MDLIPIALDYRAARAVPAQWRDALGSLATRLAAAAGDETTRQILREVGQDVADKHPLPPCDSLEDLGQAMSEALGRIEWGFARAEEGERHLVITVAAYPQVPGSEPALGLVVAMLEGMIGRWMENQGGGPMLTARYAGKGEGALAPLTFHYGQHT